jgi:hypothetical protein
MNAITDAGRRRVHAWEQTLRARRGDADTGDVFDLDLHVAVVADARVALESRGLSLTEWNLSGHTWVFGRRRTPVAAVNERTWFGFGPPLIDRFQRAYRPFLERFRGFLATYPPCFSLLYRGFDRPTLAISATRYEWPFTHNLELWTWLDEQLARGVEEGWLTLAANNRADADYVENYTGIAPHYLPSACSYVAPPYTGRRRTALVSSSESFGAFVASQLTQDARPLRAALGARFHWAELYDHRAVVFVPYNVSIMSLFEHYAAGMPIYVPERALLKRLMAEHPRDVLGSLSFSQVTGRPAAVPATARIDLNDVADPQVVDWYLDRADFYDNARMPQIRCFESWAHLDHLLAGDDPEQTAERMARERAERLASIAAVWDELPWLERLQAASGASARRPAPPTASG